MLLASVYRGARTGTVYVVCGTQNLQGKGSDSVCIEPSSESNVLFPKSAIAFDLKSLF